MHNINSSAIRNATFLDLVRYLNIVSEKSCLETPKDPTLDEIIRFLKDGADVFSIPNIQADYFSTKYIIIFNVKVQNKRLYL